MVLGLVNGMVRTEEVKMVGAAVVMVLLSLVSTMVELVLVVFGVEITWFNDGDVLIVFLKLSCCFGFDNDEMCLAILHCNDTTAFNH